MSFMELSDEDKIEQAIGFVAIDQPLPPALEQWLKDEGLYEAITSPGRADVITGS